MPDLHTGRIKWYNDSKGFGFITPDDDNQDVFMHHLDLLPPGSRDFREGARVSFTIEDGSKGRQAKNITLLRP